MVRRSAADGKARFRITLDVVRTWPGIGIPVPEVTIRPAEFERIQRAFYGDSIVYRRPEGPPKTTQLPEDAYLREVQDVDLRAPDSIVAFVNRYGPIGSRRETPVLSSGIFGVEDPDEFGGPMGDGAWAVPLWVVQEHLAWLRIAAATWGALSRSEAEVLYPDGKTRPMKAALPALGLMLDAGLKSFSPRIEIRQADVRTLTGAQPGYVTAYAAMCLQIYNDIAESWTVKVCENETCRRDFTYQRGAAKYEGAGKQGHRSDARYCTRGCAKAQVERNRRRRKAEEQIS